MSNITEFVSQLNETLRSLNVSEISRALLSTNFTESGLVSQNSFFPVQISLSLLLGLIPVIIFLIRR